MYFVVEKRDLYLGGFTSMTPILLSSEAIPDGNLPETSIAYMPRTFLLILCHLATQLSSGWHKAIMPLKFAVVQDETRSLWWRRPRYSSQFSQPCFSNWSACLMRWQSKQARRLWKSLGMDSDMLSLVVLARVNYRWYEFVSFHQQ